MFDFEKYKEKQKAKGTVNAYEPWTKEEDDKLVSEFSSHMKLYDIAKAHSRTRGAIKTRLVKLGFIDADGKAIAEKNKS